MRAKWIESGPPILGESGATVAPGSREEPDMSFLRTHGWRLALLAGGVLMAVGGPMHPSPTPVTR